MRGRRAVPYTLLVALLLLATLALAQADSGYGLRWSTVDAGGGTASGGPYVLSGTMGQPDAGTMGGGVYTLTGGFWNDTAIGYSLYLPLVAR